MFSRTSPAGSGMNLTGPAACISDGVHMHVHLVSYGQIMMQVCPHVCS